MREKKKAPDIRKINGKGARCDSLSSVHLPIPPKEVCRFLID